MSDILQVKAAQQASFLDLLNKAAPAKLAQMAVQNSGFAQAVRANRPSISIKFSK